MKLINNLSNIVCIGVLLIATSASASVCNDGWCDAITITLEATFTGPSCTLEVPETVYLGHLTYGDKIHKPVTLTVNCTSSTPNTEIYAQSLGVLVSGTTDTMVMNGSDNKTILWLEDKGKKIGLNGDTDTDNGFCEGTASRSCTLTPKTRVDMSALEGERTAVIRFNIRYKA